MAKYNHCSKCGKSLGLLNFFRFWSSAKLCPSCEQAQL